MFVNLNFIFIFKLWPRFYVRSKKQNNSNILYHTIKIPSHIWIALYYTLILHILIYSIIYSVSFLWNEYIRHNPKKKKNKNHKTMKSKLKRTKSDLNSLKPLKEIKESFQTKMKRKTNQKYSFKNLYILLWVLYYFSSAYLQSVL